MDSWVLSDEVEVGLRLVKRPEPEVGPSQVLVELRAASLNYRDLLVVDELRGSGLVPVSDGSGDIVAVGDGVHELAVGDRVVGAFFANWREGPARHAGERQALGGDIDGVLSERLLLDAQAAVKIPGATSYAEAATFPCAGVTAWHALIGDEFPLGPGDSLLTLGTGGVSMFAFQIAKLRGARVIAASSGSSKRDRLQALGADAVLDYTDPHWDHAAREITGGRGVDFIIETGGADTLNHSLRACATGGCVTLIGLLSGRATTADANVIHSNELTLRSVYVGPLTMLLDVLTTFADGDSRPMIDRVFSFEDAPAAFAHLRSGGHMGKVVIER